MEGIQTTLFETVPDATGKLVVQHNALVNARFDLTTVEMRLFMAMLARINRADTEFREFQVPLREITALSGRRLSGKDYLEVESMCSQLVTRVLHIERPGVEPRTRGNRSRRHAPDFDKIPLMAYAKYRGEEGVLLVRFNDEVMPYLLQLQRNFTKVQLVQLLKIKSPHSYRIYWLLKEYSAFGTRTLGVEELKAMLSLEGQYKQFPLFRMRVLDRARDEMMHTDLPFDYELIREGKAVTKIKFNYASTSTDSAARELSAASPWEIALHTVGVSAGSIAVVAELVGKGEVDPEYIRYVAQVQQEKFKAGKVKSLAGSVFTAITKGHLVEDFQRYQQKRQRAALRKVAVKQPDVVRYTLAEVRATYETMKKKKMTQATTFEQNLELVYLSQGFRQQRDAQGVDWLVKEA